MVDIKFSMYEDTAKGKDPDSYSKTLNGYHKILWSKQLPNGNLFDLTISSTRPFFLIYEYGDNRLKLSSDCIVHSLSSFKAMKNVLNEIDMSVVQDFIKFGSSIGGYIIFPANKVSNKATINAARGMHPYIKDRFDLTLECIRRWYINIDSPLSDTLDRYKEFFELFVDFPGYVDFFLLQDLVSKDYQKINYWIPFNNFGEMSPFPKNKEQYKQYLKNVSDFVTARNKRILESL